MTNLKVGDKVCYSAKFLRAISDYSHSSASKRGVVTKIIEFGKDFVLAEVSGDFKIRVNVKNLIKESDISKES